MGRRPRADFCMHTQHCPNLYLAQTLPVRHMALSSLAYLITKECRLII